MLFRKKIEKACQYCVHARPLNDEFVACNKKGHRRLDSKCMRFEYDPLKRIPSKPKAQDFSKYDEYDYSL